MAKLNIDVLALIFENLENDSNTLFSCLLTNKTWCQAVIPILWRNPLKYLTKEKAESQNNIIISHLPSEIKKYIQDQDITVIQQQPLYNYICYCRHLELSILEQRISMIEDTEGPSIIRDEILKLFINKNAKFDCLYLQRLSNYLNYQIHLIPGAECCLSEINFLYVAAGIIDNSKREILEGLSRMSTSIEKLTIQNAITNDTIDPILRLIEVQKKLTDVNLTCINITNVELCRSFENSLIKHADTIKSLKISWRPITNILLHLVNLTSLALKIVYHNTDWIHMESALHKLEILKALRVPSNILTNLIENTNGYLTEISSISCDGVDGKGLIEAIGQNCPNLKYLKLYRLNDSIFSEFEELLINCRYLKGLVLATYKEEVLGLDLFKILANSSPTGLFMFKFRIAYFTELKLETFKLFFNNWRGRRPILLTIANSYGKNKEELLKLFEMYKAEGVIQQYNYEHYTCESEDFEWNI